MVIRKSHCIFNRWKRQLCHPQSRNPLVKRNPLCRPQSRDPLCHPQSRYPLVKRDPLCHPQSRDPLCLPQRCRPHCLPHVSRPMWQQFLNLQAVPKHQPLPKELSYKA